MGALDGGVAAVFGAAFGGLYLPGTLIRETMIEDGQGGGSVVDIPQDCRVQIDACTEEMRQQPGYTAKDMRLLVLQSGVTGGDIDTDCSVTPLTGRHAGSVFEIAWVTQDPASSYWECRGTKIAV